jgi:hypothetical protein
MLDVVVVTGGDVDVAGTTTEVGELAVTVAAVGGGAAAGSPTRRLLRAHPPASATTQIHTARVVYARPLRPTIC